MGDTRIHLYTRKRATPHLSYAAEPDTTQVADRPHEVLTLILLNKGSEFAKEMCRSQSNVYHT